MLQDTNSMLGIITILLVIGLGLLPYEAPKGKQVSKMFYSLAWCALGGVLLSFVAESAANIVVGFLLLCVGNFGVFYYFSKGGTVYVHIQK